MNDSNTIQFTVNVKTFVQMLLNDPDCREEIVTAFKEGPCRPTEALGAANLKLAADDPDQWFTLFVATNREKNPGDKNYVFRNQKGDRISARLRRQTKSQAITVTPGTVLPRELAGHSDLLDQALKANPEAARAIIEAAFQEEQGAPAVPNEEGPPPLSEADIPAELAG